MIREIKSITEMERSVDIIRKSFATVAEDFQLNRENCPAHPSFITLAKLKEFKEKNIRMFGYFQNGRQLGFVAIERANSELYYMEKLSVLPDYRRKGLGKKLMDFVFGYVKEAGGLKVSIGIINENEKLKKWYKAYGFKEIEVRKFKHLPFLVCFMEKKIR